MGLTVTALLVAACSTAAIKPPNLQAESKGGETIHRVPAGLLGTGFRLEVPIVGPYGQLPWHQGASWGYRLGVALSYPWPHSQQHWSVRVAALQQHTYDGRGTLSYESGGNRNTTSEVSRWSATLGTLGATYSRDWWNVSVYAGAEFVMGYGGYSYIYDDFAATTLASPPVVAPSAIPTAHNAFGVLFGAATRAGVGLPLCPWLLSLVELGLQWILVDDVPVTNNRVIRDVHTLTHSEFSPTLSFALQVLL